MFMKKFELKELEWDTDKFGVNAARVNLNEFVDQNIQNNIIDFCNNYDFITICNLGNINENNYWLRERTDAFFVDMNVQFKKIISNRIVYKDEKTYVKNCLSKNDDILDIAFNSFTYSRFFNDPNLEKKESIKIYRDWTESAFLKEDKYFVISEKNSKVVGFILFSLKEGTCFIELIAVDRNYQGQNIGKSLINTMESFVRNKGIREIKVGTQVNNISAIQFYSHMGFKYINCNSIYHLWTKKFHFKGVQI